MSLGLISGYGSDSDNDNEAEDGNQPERSASYQVYLPTGESVEEKLKTLAEGAGLQGTGGVSLSAITAPPPPPPENPYLYQQPLPVPEYQQPLPNPMRSNPGNRTKKKIRGIGRKEMEMLKAANFTDIITQDLGEGDKMEFDYNTPLPFDPEASTGNLPGGPVHKQQQQQEEQQTEEQKAYMEEYMNYMAQSAGLLEGQAQAHSEASEKARAAAAGAASVDVVLWWKGEHDGEEGSHKSVAVAGEFNSWHPENGGECIWEEIKAVKDVKLGCQTCSRESHREGTECPGLLADKCFVCEKPGHFEGAPICSGIKPEIKGTKDAPTGQDLAVMDQKRQEIVKKKKKKEKRKGAWVARLKLQPGRYLYKFVVDGNWLVNHELQVSEVKDDEGQEYNQIDVAPQERKSENVDEWTEYYEKYSEWYAQYSKQYENPLEANSKPKEEVRQLTFEELQEQDRQLENYFKTGPANEYNTQRDAFKSSFRGTRMYRMRNGDNYNAKHFSQLSEGAKGMKAAFPRQKVDPSIKDHDAYVDEKDLPENQDPKSMKQRKKDKWFQGMVKKKKGCKTCGFVFCRCHGWEYKPRHCK